MRGMIALFLLLSAGPVRALDISGLTHPGVTWQTAKAKTADVTCDGKADTVLFGTAKEEIWVGIISGKGGKPQTMRFGIGAGHQDGFCAVPKYIVTEPISCSDPEMGKFPGCRPVKGCRQFSVVDEECDSFHFYWDANKKMIRWWRR